MSHVDMMSLGGEAYSDVGVGRNMDGRLEIFAIGGDRSVYHRWHGGSDNGWNDGGWGVEPLGGVCRSEVAVGGNADGRLEIFGVGYDSGVYHRWQKAPAGNWNAGGWGIDPLGGVIYSNLIVASNQDMRQEVFGRGSDNAVYHRWQTAPSNGWNADGWQSLGGAIVGDVAVAWNGAHCLEAFVRGAGAKGVYHRWQTAPSNGWNAYGWQPLGQPTEDGFIPWNVSIGQNQDRSLHVFIVYSDHNVYHRWQEGGGWNSSGWEKLEGGPMDGVVAAARNSAGLMEIFVRGHNNAWIYRLIQTAPNAPTFTSGVDIGGWRPWPGPAGSGHLLQCAGEISAIRNALGEVEIFVRDTDKSIYRLLPSH
ncbi:hypothetical protein ACFU8W_47120 [Streptomyces sp. NPDC057565]|uniref:hypothetical protein n=1 Tax=Streptomyces sp. NPDC057565 TaxID=3346169 RepID=UPI0036900E6E